MDDEGHGAHVADIVVADEALRGVSPEASLLACKVLDASGSGSTSNIIAGIERAANPGQDATTVDRVPFFLCKSNGGPG